MNTIDQQPILSEDAQIDAMLTRDARAYRDQYIDNDGFSERVMAKLAAEPLRKAALSNKVRLMIVASATLLATIIALTTGAGGNYLIDAVMDIATKTITPAVVGLALLMVSVCVMALTASSQDY